MTSSVSPYEAGDIPPIELRHRLRIAREWANLDQAQLADLMDVTRSTVSNAENCRTTPHRATVNAWALACGVPVSWLRTGAHPPAKLETEDYQSIRACKCFRKIRGRRRYSGHRIGAA